jgi:hypothetical protein
VTVTESIEMRALRWAAGDDTGMSSKAIMGVMTGHPPKDWDCYPRDSGDFGRCYRLLKIIPEWRPRITEMQSVGKAWAALATRWADVEKLYEAEDWKGVFALIQKLVRPIEDARSDVVRLGEGVTIRFGRAP